MPFEEVSVHFNLVGVTFGIPVNLLRPEERGGGEGCGRGSSGGAHVRWRAASDTRALLAQSASLASPLPVHRECEPGCQLTAASSAAIAILLCSSRFTSLQAELRLFILLEKCS